MLLPNPILSRLSRGDLRGELRAGVPRRHRRDRLPPRSRRAGTRHRDACAARSRSTSARPPIRRARSRAPDYIRKALALARQYDFMLFFDECYSEIYTARAADRRPRRSRPRTPERFKNLIVFNSLSKRSNLPGLRSGFAAGDGDFLETLRRDPQPHGAADAGRRPARLGRGVVARSSTSPSSARPTAPSSTSATSCWPASFGYRRPAGGFFLWLDMSHLGGGEHATVTLWKRCGVKVVPGAYLAQAERERGQSGRAVHSRRTGARCGDHSGRRSSVSFRSRRRNNVGTWRCMAPLMSPGRCFRIRWKSG